MPEEGENICNAIETTVEPAAVKNEVFLHSIIALRTIERERRNQSGVRTVSVVRKQVAVMEGLERTLQTNSMGMLAYVSSRKRKTCM